MPGALMADGVISLDDRPAVQAISRANTALDDHEKKVKTVLDRSGREWQVFGEGVVRVSDRGKTSLDRLLQSMEKQAALAGKTGADRMIAERDMLIRKWADEEKAVKSITAAYDKMIAAEGGGAQSKWQQFGQQVTNGIQNPLQAAGNAVGGLLERLGPLGTALSAGAVVLAGVATAAWEAAKSLGNYGLEVKNVELRTGLTSKEVGQFSFAARMAGQDVSIFERMMRGLSQAADDQSKEGEKARATLKAIGVDLHSATGEMKPTSQVLTEIAEGLSKLPEGFQRDAAALDIFKRSGIEMIPVITGLAANVKRAKELGLGATEEDLQRWQKYRENVTEAEVLWERFARKIKEPLAALVTIMFADESGHHYTMEELRQRGVNLGQFAPRTAAGDRAAAQAAGMGNPQMDEWNRNIAMASVLDYTGKIEARKQADAAVLAYQAQQGLAGQLKRAEDALSKLPKPELGKSTMADLTAYKGAEQDVESVKAQIEAQKKGAEDAKHATQELSEFRRAAAEFEKKGDEAELDAIQKIYYHRDLLLKQGAQVKATEADIAGVRGSADEQAGLLIKKYTENFEQYDQKRRSGIISAAPMGMPDKDQLKGWSEAFATQERDQKTLAKDLLSYQEAMIRLQAGPGGELDTAKKILELKVQSADTTVEKQAAALDYLKEAAKIQADADKAHDDELQRQQDALAKTSTGLLHTLLTKPSEFPKHLASTIHEAVLKPVTEGLGGMAASALHPLIYGASGEGGIAGVFKGAFGGKKDPVTAATEDNTAVTRQNSAVMATLTAILAGAMGMPSPAIASTGGGIAGFSLPSISAPAPSSTMPLIMFGGGGAPALGGGGFSPLIGGGAGGIGGGLLTSAGIPTFLGGGATGHAAGVGILPALLRAGQPGAGGAAAAPSGVAGILRDFKGMNWGGFTRSGAVYGAGTGDESGAGASSAGHISGVNGVAGAALFTGGTMLAQQGLLGSSRGTLGGTAMGAVGGAAMGFQMGGPLGAAIGGFVGLGIGLGEMIAGVESPETEAKRLVKELYAVNIDTAMAKQIVSLAQSKYAGHVSIAVRDPDVRKMLELYAQGTGQKMPLSATTPRGGSLAEQGGNLYQQASYVNGAPYTFASNLPVLGGLGGGTYPTPGSPSTAAGMGPISLSLNVGGGDAASFFTGQVVTPSYVADASMAAQNASYGRVQQSANMQVPGLVTGT
jgi:hypothetical protein